MGTRKKTIQADVGNVTPGKTTLNIKVKSSANSFKDPDQAISLLVNGKLQVEFMKPADVEGQAELFKGGGRKIELECVCRRVSIGSTDYQFTLNVEKAEDLNIDDLHRRLAFKTAKILIVRTGEAESADDDGDADDDKDAAVA